MKSIKNQYIALKEGKMTEAQFMRNVKMTLPQYISNVTLFKQAERILLNKGIISENISNTAQMGGITTSKGTAGYVDNTDKNGGDYNPKERAANLAKLKNFGLKKEEQKLSKLQFSDLKSGDVLTNKFSGTKYTVTNVTDKTADIQQGDDGDEMEIATLNNYELFKEELDEEIETVQDPKTKEFTKRMKLSDKDKKTVGKIQALMAKEKPLKEGVDMKELEDTLKRVKKDNPGKKVGYFFTKDDPKGYKISIDGKHINEAKDTSLTGYYNQDGEEQYSKFDELDNMNAQEIMAGYVMEKQDNPDIDKKEAVKLVIKNLKKDQFYYTNYKLTGIRGLQPTEFTSTKRKSEFDEMEEVNKNGDNFVDDKNKMVVIKEAKLEDVKALLSDETLRDSDVGYGADNDVSITYKSNDELPFDDLSKLEDKYQVYKDVLSGEDEPTTVQYFISDKFKSSSPSKSEPAKSSSDEDVFENKSNVKAKLKEMIRKMMKEMFDGRDNLTDIE